jgi:beta-galactosidase
MMILRLALIASLISSAAAEPRRAHETAGDPVARVRTSFNGGWLFERFGPMPDGSTRAEPNALEKSEVHDGAWRGLDLPHDWGIEGPFRSDLPANTGKLPWAGVGWYRKHFRVSSGGKGERFFVDFDGAMSHAKVWLNGSYLGEWPYGYASFRLEMTQRILLDRENVIAVRLDNPPESSRWYPGSGIYRNVWLVRTAPVHVAHSGIFVTTPEVASSAATVRVMSEVENQSGAASDASLLVEIFAPGRRAVLASVPAQARRIPAGQRVVFETEIPVPSPALWNLESPALYRARISVLGNGRVIDTLGTSFGIRKAEFTADGGFVLNGRRIPINGVCNHHDLGLMGTAVNEAALRRQIRLLKEMGCNAIRTSHNPPAPELLDLCDQTGMLVLDEAFDCWVKGKTPNDYSTLFAEWHDRDIRAFVRRDRNHPCVIAWSAGNEVQEQKNGNLFESLRGIFRSEDSTRPVTAACDQADAGFNGFQNSVDIFGYNYKPRLYAKFHDANPRKALFGSETASCVSTNGEYLFPVSGDGAKGFADGQVTSYDVYAPYWATTPDVEFEAQDKNPFVAGEFVWTGFDYLGEPTPYWDDTCRSRSSYFGIFDLCGFTKDRFFLYQARWRPEFPLAHILPHWNWPERIGETTPVHVYTSGDEAELFLNGQSMGRKVKQPYEYRLRWDDVRYAPGTLKVLTYKKGKPWASDEIRTTGPAARIELSSDRTAIDADGRDLAFVTVSLVDAAGAMVPGAANPVRFTVSGPGTIAAVGNGDPTDHGSFRSDRTRAFHGRCMLVIQSRKGKAGAIRVTAESDAVSMGTALVLSK